MKDRTCTMPDCDKRQYSRGYCQMHFSRWKRHGDPTVRLRKIGTPTGLGPCSVDGCEKEVHTKSLCPMHYQRMRIHGSLESPMPTVTERFLAKVQKTETCWLWQAALDGKGYGQMRVISDGADRLAPAHRLSYELFIGEIPEGKVVDHICHVVTCVNPEHLRAVWHKENMEHRSGAARHSKTGVRGVSPKRNKYRASIGHNGEHFIIGTYSTIAEAEAAVIAKRLEVFTHNDLDRQ